VCAAYAEAGDLSNAVKWHEKTIDLAPEKSEGGLRSLLDLYNAHLPYRQEVKR
jgi:hypothetical protein